jgi:hypothetical protein
MQYKLQPLYSTDQSFNGDVITSDEEKYMGRLYILATEDSKLLNLGIEKEWFLAHASIDALIYGHINNEGKWSLSACRSLEPSLTYTTRNKLFNKVFSPEYVWEISHLREEVTLNISQFASNPDNFNSNEDDNSNVPDTKSTNKIVEELSINSLHIDILRDLIMHSHPDDLAALKEKYEEIEGQEKHTVNESQSVFDDDNFTEIMNYFQRGSAPKLNDEELFHAQINLTERVMNEYESQKTNEFVFVPFGTVTVYAEENYFVLHDSEDEHTIFTATFDTDVIHGLNDIDALKIEMILSQLETEDYRRIRNSEQEIEVDKTEIKQQTGMEYGA